MKVALIICGLHYYENYNNHRIKNLLIDFRLFYKNIKINLLNFFTDLQADIDIFLSTNNSKIEKYLNDYYNPKYIYYDNFKNKIFKLQKIMLIFNEYYKNKNINYDIICITRFDIYFLEKITLLNTCLNKFNVVSILEKDDLIDDNLYIFPFKYLEKFNNILENGKDDNPCNLHFITKSLFDNFEINIIKNEKNFVNDLSFFKLHFFYNIEFIINKYYFTENVWYNNYNSQFLYLNENNIYLKKTTNQKTILSWLGYIIEKKGKYNLTFDIKSDKDILNYDFIKLNNPVKFYRTQNIYSKNLYHVSLEIEVFENNDLLCFIFDDYENEINIYIKDFNLKIIENKKLFNQ